MIRVINNIVSFVVIFVTMFGLFIANVAGQGTSKTQTAQLNSTYFVGSVEGFYTTIQSAITKSCTIGSGAVVNIPAGSSPSDNISSITGGCTAVTILDSRSIPNACYSWSGSQYSIASCASGTATPGSPLTSTQYNNGGVLSGVPMQLWDVAHSQEQQPFFNYGNTSIQNRVALSKSCGTGVQPVYSGAGPSTICNEILDSFSDPGYYIVGQPPYHSSEVIDYSYNGLGITAVRASGATDRASVAHDGDNQLSYDYYFYRSSLAARSDEATSGGSLQMREMPGPIGTIVTGGTSAQRVESTWTNNGTSLGVTSYLVDTSQIIASGNLLAETDPGGLDSRYYTTSDTHAIDTGYGHITGDCGASGVPPPRNAPVSNTCTVDLTSDGGFGTINTSGVMCFADYSNPECVTVTAATTGSTITVTNLAIYPHPAGTPVEQGPMSIGSVLVFDNGTTDPTASFSAQGMTWSQFNTYFVSGALTSHTINYTYEWRGGQNGKLGGGLPANDSVVLTTITGDGVGNFTAVTPAHSNIALNNFTATGTQSIQVQGSTCTPTCNGVVTGVVISNSGMAIAWHQAGGTATTGSGGTISIVGNNAYRVLQAARSAAIPVDEYTPLYRDPLTGNVSGHPWGTGGLEVTANNDTWAPGDRVVQPNSYSQSAYVNYKTFYRMVGDSQNAGTFTNRDVSGPGNSGAYDDYVTTSDTVSQLLGNGGGLVGHGIEHRLDFQYNPYEFAYVPQLGSPFVSWDSFIPNDPYDFHPFFSMPDFDTPQIGYRQSTHRFETTNSDFYGNNNIIADQNIIGYNTCFNGLTTSSANCTGFFGGGINNNLFGYHDPGGNPVGWGAAEFRVPNTGVFGFGIGAVNTNYNVMLSNPSTGVMSLDTVNTRGNALGTLNLLTLNFTGSINSVPSATFAFLDATSSIQTQFNSLQTQINLKAPLASPTFTGTPLVPTASPLTSNTQAASTAYVDAAVTAGGGGSSQIYFHGTVTAFAPGTLNTCATNTVAVSGITSSMGVLAMPLTDPSGGSSTGTLGSQSYYAYPDAGAGNAVVKYCNNGSNMTNSTVFSVYVFKP